MISLLSEDEFLHKAVTVPLQPLPWELARRYGVDILVRRDDLIDVHLSGNKFYKLFYNLQVAKEAGHQTLLSFGGAYSNHLYALAAAGHRFGFKTVGVIRGERPQQLSATLRDAENWGMKLEFVSREKYREKMAPELHEYLERTYGDFYVIPEGGANVQGVRGAKVIGWALREQINEQSTSVCVACGTGSTLSGIAAGLYSGARNPLTAIGFSVLKGDGQLGEDVHRQCQHVNADISNWRLLHGYHAGGYGKKLPPALTEFMCAFECETSLILDPVYTVKMFWGVAQLLQQNYWPKGSRLILIHSGGLQGRRGFKL